jgi:uncharacterized caspase-like protein
MMSRRYALVVGVGSYAQLDPLRSAVRDAEMMAHVLKYVAGFDEVGTLLEPDQSRLAEAIECLFASRSPDDVILLYYSGHGIKDERGGLYLTVPATRKHASGELVRASAVSCRHIHDVMGASRSRRHIVVLDCCFSGAFAEGMLAKDSGNLDLRAQLGGEGRVVLASSASTQYSFDAAETGLSTYTQFLVHGIASGEADLNHDGAITVDELHEYARARVQAVHPAMSPQIFPSREGYSIVVSTARKVDPQRAYAAKVRELADSAGAVTRVAAQVLTLHRQQLGLGAEEARRIEDVELTPRRTHAVNRKTLRKAVYLARRNGRLGAERSLLGELRIALGLGEGDLAAMVEQPLALQRREVLGWRYWLDRALAYGAAAVVLFSAGFAVFSLLGSGGEEPSTSPTRGAPAPAEPSRATPSRATPAPAAPPDAVEVAPLDERPSDLAGEPVGEPVSNPDITPSSWVLRLSSKYSLDEARQQASIVATRELAGRRLRPQIVRHGPYYCVLIGPFGSRAEADSLWEGARSILGQGAVSHYMPSWCPYLGPQLDGVRRCAR